MIQWMKLKLDGDDDREGPRILPINGNVILSPDDAALLIDLVLRSPHKEAWMVDALTKGSHAATQ